MPYGYLGQNTPNQTVSNSGVFSISDVASLEKQGKFGGSLELIEEQTVSSVSAIDFTSIQETKYDVHFIQLNNMEASASLTLGMQLYESGVLETASVYQYVSNQGRASGSFFDNQSTTSTSMRLLPDIDSSQSGSGYCYLYNAGKSSKYTFSSFHKISSGISTQVYEFGESVLPQASIVNGFRINTSTGTISGTVKLFGVKQI